MIYKIKYNLIGGSNLTSLRDRGLTEQEIRNYIAGLMNLPADPIRDEIYKVFKMLL